MNKYVVTFNEPGKNSYYLNGYLKIYLNPDNDHWVMNKSDYPRINEKMVIRTLFNRQTYTIKIIK